VVGPDPDPCCKRERESRDHGGAREGHMRRRIHACPYEEEVT